MLVALLPSAVRPAPAAAAGPPFRVLIDAGHGGKDPGAVSPLLPLAEKDVALDVALRLGTALERRGVSVVQTRTDDRDVALAERAALAARVGAHALVSIHLNATANGNAVASGAEGWHGAGARDAELAGALLDGLATAVRRHGMGVRGTRAGTELAVLRTAVPAALIELGYVTSPTDARALAQSGARGDAAEGLAEGVLRFRDGRTQARPQIMLAGMGGAGAGAITNALPNLYFVRPGDTLRAIASHLGVPDAALKLLDGGQPAAQPLHVGQPLRIGKDGVSPPAASAEDRLAVRLTTVRQSMPVVPAAPRGVYVVTEGDTLTRIAVRHGVGVGDLVRTNGLNDPDLIKPGQRLRVNGASGPATPITPVAAYGAARYTVRTGDTLSHVAARWGTSVEAVRRANGLADADHVEADRVLIRPTS